jgi:hypothetical protein
MIAILLPFATSRRTISKVFSGDWTTSISYSSPPLDPIGPNVTISQTGKVANYLKTSFRDEPILINLSFLDLSGNITFRDEVYDFNLTHRAPPFVSSDIDLRELGFAHCILTCYITMRCSFVSENQSFTATFRKIEVDTTVRDIVIRVLQFGAVIASGGLAYWVYTKCVGGESKHEEGAEKEAGEAAQGEQKDEERAQAEEGEPKTEESGEPVQVEQKAGEEGEAEVPRPVRELEPDESGKFKTD